MPNKNVPYKTAAELAEIKELRKTVHLLDGCVLHYNGPGSTGFGVKRTAMLMPETAMLMIAPMGCSRSGTVPAEEFGFAHRMFYLHIDDRSMASGAYLKQAREAARCIADTGEFKGLLICMTCLDALAGTDAVSLAKSIGRETGLTVTSTFMDPIARDGNFGPMVQVRKAITDCIVPDDAADTAPAVDLLGVFAQPADSCELYEMLAPAGIAKIRTVAGCKTLAELRSMSNAKLTIAVHPQALVSAADLEKRLGIPYVKALTSYNPERIDQQYAEIFALLGSAADSRGEARRAAAEEALARFGNDFRGKRIAVGEAIHGSPFDIARMLIRSGVEVPFVFRDMIRPDDQDDIRALAAIAPELRVYSGVDPATCSAPQDLPETDIALGLDAGYFAPDAISIGWDFGETSFGYEGIVRLIRLIRDGCAEPRTHREQMRGTYLTV